MIEVLNKPMYDIFMSECAGAKKSIKLCAPFVKSDIVEDILKNKKSETEISLVTNVNLMNFCGKSSDVEALQKLVYIDKKVYTYPKLHAKYYIFDNKRTIITSANLTSLGLKKNYEYGVIIEKPNLVEINVADYSNLCSNELTGEITRYHLKKINDILDSLPPMPRHDIPNLNLDAIENDTAFDYEVEIILKNLTGWERAVLQEVDRLGQTVFTTEDFKLMKPRLSKLYPNNRHIDEKIRQQLQFLRDLGLVQFESRGVYRKLWS